METTKHYSGIKRYIASRVGIPDDAEDLAQSVFLEFYSSDNNGNALEPYLLGIAKNLIADYYRQKSKQPSILQLNTKAADEIAFEDYNNASRVKYLAEEIEAVALKLPPKPREAVKLRLIDELSFNGAASKANCSIGAFYERFYGGIKIIKKSLRS